MAFNLWVATENFFKSALFFLVTASSEPAVDKYKEGSEEKSNSSDLLSGPDLY